MASTLLVDLGLTFPPSIGDVCAADDVKPQAKSLPVATRRISGRVLKPDGSSAPGAKLRYGPRPALNQTLKNWGYTEFAEFEEFTTDALGHFQVDAKIINEIAGLDPERIRPSLFQIAASLEGFGGAWISYDLIKPDQELILQLVEDHVIRAKIIDLEGVPVAKTEITLGSIRKSPNEDLTPWLNALASGQRDNGSFALISNLVPETLLGIPATIITDGNGECQIRGVGKDRVLGLSFKGGDVAHRRIDVVTRESIPTFNARPNHMRELILSATFTLAIPPMRLIEGVVVDSQTGSPLPDVTIQSYRFGDVNLGNDGAIKTKTDDKGRFAFRGMPKSTGNQLLAIPSDDQPYFYDRIDVPDPEGMAAVQLKLELRRGTWITGKVTDKQTGLPVINAGVQFMPFTSNPNLKAFPNFVPQMYSDPSRHRTDANGHFRIVGLPGPAVIGLTGYYEEYRRGVGYAELTCDKNLQSSRLAVLGSSPPPDANFKHALHEVSVRGDFDDFKLDLELDSGQSIRVQAVDEHGDAVKDAEFVGFGIRPPIEVRPDGLVTVRNLGSDEKRQLWIYHPGRHLGKILDLSPPYDSATIKVTLLPCAKVKGRLLLLGEPIANARVTRHKLSSRDPSLLQLPISTTNEGRFELDLLPDGEFGLMLLDPPPMYRATSVSSSISARAGDVHDLGDLTLGDDQKFHPVDPAQK